MTLEDFRIATADLPGDYDIYFDSKIPDSNVIIDENSIEVSEYIEDLEIKSSIKRINLIVD